MKKLIIKTTLFAIPFFISFCFLKYFYVSNQGDLFRLGYFINDYNYNWEKIFSKEFQRKRRFDLVSEIDLNKTHHYDIFVIGDSFTEQDAHAYHDYLAEYSGKKILQLDRFYHENPLETLKRLSKADFFEKIKCKYVLLQTVERAVTERGFILADQNKSPLTIKDLQKTKDLHDKNTKNNKLDFSYKVSFFSKDLIRLPLYRFLYLFSDNGLKTDTYKVETTKSFFSTPEKFCLFYSDDLEFRTDKCDKNAIIQTNNYINELAEMLNSKKMRLVTLISPDKYEIFHPYFREKNKYPAPIFFNTFEPLKKNYINVNSRQIISNAVLDQKDIYYLDDTHWSAFAAKKIAGNLNKIL